MSQTKQEFHVEQILKLIQEIRHRENPKGQLEHDLDWIAYHARQLEPCKDCAKTDESQDEATKK